MDTVKIVGKAVVGVVLYGALMFIGYAAGEKYGEWIGKDLVK